MSIDILQSPLFVTVCISMTVYNYGLSVFFMIWSAKLSSATVLDTVSTTSIMKENARFVLISIFD